FVIAIVGFRGELKPLIYDLEKGTLAWAIAGGLALTVAVTSLFQALSLGPANVVVPIYGMFRRRVTAWRDVSRRANDLAQDRWARCCCHWRGAHLDLAKYRWLKRGRSSCRLARARAQRALGAPRRMGCQWLWPA